MSIDTMIIDKRYCGPDGIGNGGYVAGRLAAYLRGSVEVTLLKPAPLEVELTVTKETESRVTLLAGELTVAEAGLVTFDLDIPGIPTMTEAAAARENFHGHASHPAPNCFVCGPLRPDGLSIHAGRVQGQDYVACPWTPAPSLAGPDGHVAQEFIWAALDCPGAFAVFDEEMIYILLGKLAVRQLQLVRPGEALIVTGWLIGSEGRKYLTGTALFNADGALLAQGRATWIKPRQ